MESGEPWKVLVVESDLSPGQRLDAWLARHLPGTSRPAAARLVEAGSVTLDGHPARKGSPIAAGQTVEVLDPPPPERWTPLPDAEGPLEVLLVDPDFVAVAKPPGIPSTPRSPGEAGTLAGRLAARFPECAGLGRSPGDAGLLQRLDRGTSGAVLAARSPEIYAELLRSQRRGGVTKRYVALVHGPETPLPAEIAAPLGPAGTRGGRSRKAPDGRPARTVLELVATRGDWRLVRAVIHRGARHQIRAHLAGIGAPIAGDAEYGGPPVPGLSRPFLHAAALSFPHPRTGAVVDIESPLPDDLASVLVDLGIGPALTPRRGRRGPAGGAPRP